MEFTSQLPDGAVVGYTDGSGKNEEFTAAVYVPKWDIRRAWHVKGAQAIWEAEAMAIRQCLSMVYECEESPPLACILSDSKTCLQKLDNQPFEQDSNLCGFQAT